MKNILAGKGGRPGVKALLLAFLIVLMYVPMSFVNGLVWERQQRASDVRFEVGQAWGGQSQTIAGPFLVVPYDEQITTHTGETTKVSYQKRYAVFLPEELNITADMQSAVRYRGIYDVTTYTADATLSGRFQPPDMSPYADDEMMIHWDGAFLSLGITDNRGVKNALKLQWGAGAPKDFEPGTVVSIYESHGVYAPLSQDDIVEERAFRIDLKLNGSEQIEFIPVGEETHVDITSDWPDPSFKGGFLPTKHDIRKDGFSANWDIPELARSFPQSWSQSKTDFRANDWEPAQRANPFYSEMIATAFRAELFSEVDFYQKVERSTKYALLFFGFTFLTFYLYEVLVGARVHVVQYLMVAASQFIFYLLLLSFAEHIGFFGAYTVAALANIGMISLYVGNVVRHRGFAFAICGVLIVVYGLLFSLLQVTDYALLFGSIATFLALSATMFLTRNIDWYAMRDTEEALSEDDGSKPIPSPAM